MKSNRTKNSGKFVALAAGALAAGLTLGAAATTYHVDRATGNDNDDGELWSTAFKTVRKALLEAGQNPGPHEIFVAAGTYYPDEIDDQDSNLRSDSFELVNGVKLYGGFLNGDDFEDRDPIANETILSGDIDQDNVLWDTDNSWHVVKADGVDETTVLNGFTISNGYANGGGMDDNGGGILILDASLVIVHCTLTTNLASKGGGIYVEVTGTAAPVVFSCSIIQNIASEGSGMRLEGAPELILVVNCLFAKQGMFGGAIHTNGPDVDVINCTFDWNDYAYCSTSQFQSANGSHLRITNSIIQYPNHGPHFIVETETGSLVTVSFSNVIGGLFLTPNICDPVVGVIDGGGNIDADPMFCDPLANNNYRLQDGSPCIDTGSDAAVPDDIADVDHDGNTTETLPWDRDTRIRQFDGDAGSTLVDMGAYENQHHQLCPADLNDDCEVGVGDLLILLAAWGPNPGHPADLDCNREVGVSDLLILLADWGLCPCGVGPEPLTLEEELADACLTQENWDEFEDVMTDPNASQEDKDRYNCWMIHYLDHCNKCTCEHQPECPSPDPFSST